MKYGRVDVTGPAECPEEGRLPGKRIINTNRGTLPLKLVPTPIILSKMNLRPSSTPKEIKAENLSWPALILFQIAHMRSLYLLKNPFIHASPYFTPRTCLEK
jgi:hypothetical protein